MGLLQRFEQGRLHQPQAVESPVEPVAAPQPPANGDRVRMVEAEVPIEENIWNSERVDACIDWVVEALEQFFPPMVGQHPRGRIRHQLVKGELRILIDLGDQDPAEASAFEMLIRGALYTGKYPDYKIKVLSQKAPDELMKQAADIAEVTGGADVQKRLGGAAEASYWNQAGRRSDQNH